MISRSQLILIFILLAAIGVLCLQPFFDQRIPVIFRFDNRDHEYDIKALSIAGDFNNWTPQRHFLSDRDSNHVWTATIPLSPGRHLYRFVVNNERWLRDPDNLYYEGPYSNSVIYVDTIAYPKLLSTEPANGSWLYTKKDSAYFKFDRDITRQSDYKIVIELDGVRQDYNLAGMSANIKLPFLFEGEHQWQVFAINSKSDTINRQSGIWYINFENRPPVAEAGYTLFAYKNQMVKLNGGRSYDPDLDGPLSFSWVKTASSSDIIFKNRNTPFPLFQTAIPGTYKFQLTVQDTLGASDTDITEVIILDAVQPSVHFQFNPKLKSENINEVALVGEFNQWNESSHPMKWNKDSLIWEINIPMPAGQYEYKFVINNVAWINDPANPDKIEDGWQGFNSIKKVNPYFDFQPAFELDTISENNAGYRLSVKNLPEDGRGYWYADSNNPQSNFNYSKNRLFFKKDSPPGVYYFYYVFKYKDTFTKPLTLLVNHFATTHFSDFSASPQWSDTSVVYEVFVRRFTKPGTINALIDKLDYLKLLGVNVLWLMPVYEGPTDHGYAPTKLFDIESDYGTLSDYQALIGAAHDLGMKVVFDFVANHLSDQHRFVYAAADNSKSPLRDWFHWQPSGMWGYHNDWDTLVNLNFENPQVRHLMLEVGRFWLGLCVDGFRCDVAWAIPHNFWKDFRRALKEINPECLIINEVLPRQPAYHDNEFDMSYDTDFYGNVLDVLQDKKPLSALEYGFRKTKFNYPKSAKDLRYLENHDLERFIKLFNQKQTRLMAALLFTVPGTPLIYYGQESALQEMRPQFPETPNPKWFDFYTALIKLRKEMPALTLGSMETIDLNNEQKTWHFRRSIGNEKVDMIINLSKQVQKINLHDNVSKIYFNEENLIRKNSVYYLKAESFIICKVDN